MGNLMDFFKNNLGHVAPILIAGAFAIAIIIERAKALFQTYSLKDTDGFFNQLRTLVIAGKVADALALCDQQIQKPVAKVAKQGLLRSHQPEHCIENGLQIEVSARGPSHSEAHWVSRNGSKRSHPLGTLWDHCRSHSLLRSSRTC